MKNSTVKYFKQNYSATGGVMCVNRIVDGNDCKTTYLSGRVFTTKLSPKSLMNLDSMAVKISEKEYLEIYETIRF